MRIAVSVEAGGDEDGGDGRNVKGVGGEDGLVFARLTVLAEELACELYFLSISLCIVLMMGLCYLVLRSALCRSGRMWLQISGSVY